MSRKPKVLGRLILVWDEFTCFENNYLTSVEKLHIQKIVGLREAEDDETPNVETSFEIDYMRPYYPVIVRCQLDGEARTTHLEDKFVDIWPSYQQAKACARIIEEYNKKAYSEFLRSKPRKMPKLEFFMHNNVHYNKVPEWCDDPYYKLENIFVVPMFIGRLNIEV